MLKGETYQEATEKLREINSMKVSADYDIRQWLILWFCEMLHVYVAEYPPLGSRHMTLSAIPT